MKIAKINPIAPDYVVPKKLAQMEEKNIIRDNVSLPMESYRDFNINFRGRTPENFYEQEYNIKNMPSTMKKYLDQDYENRKHIPPEQIMSEVFKFIPLSGNVEEVKEIYPQEELFANLHEASTKGRTGILSDIKIAQEIEGAPLLKNSNENFGVYLLRKIYTEGKTIREINKDFYEKDLNEVYKGAITQPITYGTTSAYGIKYPKSDFWHSFIATRDEYKKFFVENMPKVEKEPKIKKESTKETSQNATKKEATKRKYTIKEYQKAALKNDIKNANGDEQAIVKSIRRRFPKDDPEASFIVKYLSPIMTIAADKIHLSEEERAFAEYDKANNQKGKMFARFWKANPALLEHYSTAITDTIELFEETYGGGGNVPIDKDFRVVTSPEQKTLDYVSEDFLELLDYTQTIAPKRNARYLEHDRLQEEWNKHFLERYGEVKEQEVTNEIQQLVETPKSELNAKPAISLPEGNITTISLISKAGVPLEFHVDLDKEFGSFLRDTRLANFPTKYADFYIKAIKDSPLCSNIVKKSIVLRQYRNLLLEGQLITDDEIAEALNELDNKFIDKHYNESQAAIFAFCEVQSKESNPSSTYKQTFNESSTGRASINEAEKQNLLNKLYSEYKRPITKSEANKASIEIINYILGYNVAASDIAKYGSLGSANFTDTFINALKNSMLFDSSYGQTFKRPAKRILKDIFIKMIMQNNGIKSILKKDDSPELKNAKIQASTYTIIKYYWRHSQEIHKHLSAEEQGLMLNIVAYFKEAMKLAH